MTYAVSADTVSALPAAIPFPASVGTSPPTAAAPRAAPGETSVLRARVVRAVEEVRAVLLQESFEGEDVMSPLYQLLKEFPRG